MYINISLRFPYGQLLFDHSGVNLQKFIVENGTLSSRISEKRKTSRGVPKFSKTGNLLPFAPVLKVPKILVELKAPLGPVRITPEKFENAAYFCG